MSTPAPTMDSFTSQSKTVAVEVFAPSSAGKHPAIVVAHGADGMTVPWDVQIRDFAAELAGNGYVAVIPHYFDTTGPPADSGPISSTIIAMRDIWVKTIDDALKYAAGRPDVDLAKLGSLGFSLGGHLVLRQALNPPPFQPVKAVVEFFAPIAYPGISVADGLTGRLANLPPILIHHGANDTVVPPAQSALLVTMLTGALKKQGTDFDYEPYPGEGHGFTVPADIVKSKSLTVAFFGAHIT